MTSVRRRISRTTRMGVCSLLVVKELVVDQPTHMAEGLRRILGHADVAQGEVS